MDIEQTIEFLAHKGITPERFISAQCYDEVIAIVHALRLDHLCAYDAAGSWEILAKDYRKALESIANDECVDELSWYQQYWQVKSKAREALKHPFA
jgi:hypothetical protein